jgi:two-component system OmpR family response regulator
VKVLVVEDDQRIAETVRRGLELEGFAVDVAFDGDDGYWKASSGGFDAIVLDIMLPGRNGFVVCRDLRAAGIRTPIVMLTAKDGELDEAEALDTGADDYVTKPFSFPVLVARLRAVLRRSGGDATLEPTKVGSLVVDSRARRIWSSGNEIELSRREFDVLEHLARRAGEVVRKSQLLDAVWDVDFGGDPNIVEVYVGRLRRKVDEPFGTRHIVTVRGVGYRLDGERG